MSDFDMPSISFRRVQEPDIPVIHAWLNTPEVARWYYQADLSWDGVMRKWLPRARGEEPRTEHFVIEVDGRGIGVIKWYRLADYPEYQQSIGVEGEAVSIDLFIGEPSFLHKGLGPRAVCELLREAVFPRVPHKVCYIGPEQGNVAAIRAYEKAGFRHVRTVCVPGERDLLYVMRAGERDLAK